MISLVENGDIVFLLPWLMAYTRREDTQQRDIAQEASEEETLELTSSVCRRAGEVKVVARSLPAEPLSAGNEETWTTLVENVRQKTTPPVLRPRRLQCCRAPPRQRA